jgi:hypothetical protein
MAVLHSPPSSGRRRCQAVVMGIGVAMEVEVAVAAVYMLMVPASRQLPARPGGGLLALVVVVVVLANGRLLLLLLLLVVVLCINMKDSLRVEIPNWCFTFVVELSCYPYLPVPLCGTGFRVTQARSFRFLSFLRWDLPGRRAPALPHVPTRHLWGRPRLLMALGSRSNQVCA